MSKLLVFITAAILLMGGLWASGVPVVTYSNASPPPNHKVTLCHATGSSSNPYVIITVDVASAGEAGNLHGHRGHADDIIPSFEYDGVIYPGQGNQEILANACNVVVTTSTTTSTINSTTSTVVTETLPTTTVTIPVISGPQTTSTISQTTTRGTTSTTPIQSQSTTTTTSTPTQSSSVPTSGSTTATPKSSTTPSTTSTLEKGKKKIANNQKLPFTGVNASYLLGIGLTLILFGIILFWLNRRFSSKRSN